MGNQSHGCTLAVIPVLLVKGSQKRFTISHKESEKLFRAVKWQNLAIKPLKFFTVSQYGSKFDHFSDSNFAILGAPGDSK